VSAPAVELRDLSGYEGLAAAVLLQAVRDLEHGNGQSASAWQFLTSPGCEELVANVLCSLDLHGGDLHADRLEARELLQGLLDRLPEPHWPEALQLQLDLEAPAA